MIGRECRLAKLRLSWKTPSSQAPSPKNAMDILFSFLSLAFKASPTAMGIVPATRVT